MTQDARHQLHNDQQIRVEGLIEKADVNKDKTIDALDQEKLKKSIKDIEGLYDKNSENVNTAKNKIDQIIKFLRIKRAVEI